MIATLKIFANLGPTPSVTTRAVTALMPAALILTMALYSRAGAVPYKPGFDACNNDPGCLFAK
jgi:hypothetical protein